MYHEEDGIRWHNVKSPSSTTPFRNSTGGMGLPKGIGGSGRVPAIDMEKISKTQRLGHSPQPIHAFSPLQVPRTGASHNPTRRSMSVEPYASPKQLPVLWAQQRYFANRRSVSSLSHSRPKAKQLALGSSQYAPHSHGEFGQPTAEWMRVTSPKNWPEKKRPASRLFTRTSTLEWQSLHRGEKEPVEKLALLKSTKKDRELRRAAEDAEDADAVRRLSTPEGGRREQLLEEVLRQLQGDGPMERLQSALTSLDEKRHGIVSAEDFKRVLQEIRWLSFSELCTEADQQRFVRNTASAPDAE